MAITSSAKRAVRTSERRRVYNLRRLNTMRDAIKSFRKTIADKKKIETEKEIAVLYRAIDKAAKRGVIKKNTAARKKSHLTMLLRKRAQKK